ncbi:UDP:flavonoid glycosyltransferase YjiC (YdhE family) [Arthrobacter sp. B2I5]|uniref:glycosyltransferase n=1 Tax=Arthrobacter sp. B2I5 TaxID=3042266 RepID=UPI00278A6E79|nr:nucleotide disphospho-sugar-binding domain-containing protein [Arthrobacter sp. B2I5]MDQ0825602.1 UDP:flavonoid glycosyltransferase YjiC (YdhE family) [Arthrobacter sp. B2I5]
MGQPGKRPPLDVVFLSGDIGGNLPPTFAIAGELALRRHRVTIAGVRPRAQSSAPTGVTMVQLPALAQMDVTRPTGRFGHRPALVRMALGRGTARDVRSLLARQRADVIVVDGVMLTSLREALSTGTPSAVLFHSLGKFWEQGMGNPALNGTLRPFGLSPLALLERCAARLLPTDREIDPAGQGRCRIAFDWIGTTEHASPPAPRAPENPPLILVSLSTVWQKNQEDVYRRIIIALGQLTKGTSAVRAIVTTGGVPIRIEQPLPANVELQGRIPHEQVMPHVDLVIGHGGHSTTLKALAHSIPLLVLPLDPSSDQPLIANVIERNRLGRTLSANALPETIGKTINDILTDPAIVAATARTGERLRGQNGARNGADWIERIGYGP